MAELKWILLYVHLTANLVWIGSIASVAEALRTGVANPRERGSLARRLFRQLAEPAFGISFLAGLGMLALTPGYYFVQTKFMHAKLFFALGVITLHHVIGARAKHMERGERADPGRVGSLALGLVCLVALVVFFVLRKPF